MYPCCRNCCRPLPTVDLCPPPRPPRVASLLLIFVDESKSIFWRMGSSFFGDGPVFWSTAVRKQGDDQQKGDVVSPSLRENSRLLALIAPTCALLCISFMHLHVNRNNIMGLSRKQLSSCRGHWLKARQVKKFSLSLSLTSPLRILSTWETRKPTL